MKILNIEQYNLSKEQLINFGFEKESLTYRKNILNDEFRIEIKLVDKTLEIEVYDLGFGEVYPLFSVESASGELVSNIREEVDKIIKNLLSFNTDNQIYAEILDYVKKQYTSEVVKPFNKNPDIEALITNKNKWYALFLDIEYNKLQKDSSISDKVKIVNLKYNSEEIPKLQHRNIFPAYHMNKKHWISVVLDENIDLDYMKELLGISYNLVDK